MQRPNRLRRGRLRWSPRQFTTKDGIDFCVTLDLPESTQRLESDDGRLQMMDGNIVVE